MVQSTIDDPEATVATRDTRHLPGGGRMDDPATGYLSKRGGYVIRNDRTGDIVQVSDRTDPNWMAPWP
jgi:filamentous hemagglutinin